MNKVIFDCLDLMDLLSAHYDLKINNENRYHSIWENLKKLSQDKELFISKELRKKINDFIIELKIERLKQNIFSYLNPNQSAGDADPNYVDKLCLDMLNNYLFMKYFVLILGTINFVQKNNLLLLKYSKAIYNTGWSELSKVCRGKVIDISTRKIVVYPFDKFFNLNENSETNEFIILEQISKADIISVTEKKDGSLIAITRVEGVSEPLINTNGSFDNEQIDLAKKIFKKKYNYFYNNLPPQKTFIFELICPEEKHIVDYGNEEKLYLLGIRDLSSFQLLQYNENLAFAKTYELDCTEKLEFTNLNQFIEKANGKFENKEGWVFRVKSKDFDTLFKLKFHDYFLLHRTASSISIEKVYKLLIGKRLDDYIEISSENKKEEIASLMEEINIIFTLAQNFVEKRAIELLKKNDLSFETFTNDKLKMIAFIKNVLATEPYGHYIIQYVKNPSFKANLFKGIAPKKFEEKLLVEFG